ncbi:MAG: SHOCT domain-containing protein, partial [Chloroflexota bacterium]
SGKDTEMILTGINMILANDYQNIFQDRRKEEVIGILKELYNLKVKGIISNDEFETKKKELLNKI